MFDTHEFKTLMQALDALEKEEKNSAFLSGMLNVVLAPLGEKDAAVKESKRELKEVEHKTVALKETIILLKAKLIRLRDEALVEDVTNSLERR